MQNTKETNRSFFKEDADKQSACVEQGHVLVKQLIEAGTIKKGSVSKQGDSSAKVTVTTNNGRKASVDVVMEVRGTSVNPEYVFRVKATKNENEHAKKDYSFTRAVKLGLEGMQDKMEKVLAYALSFQMMTKRQTA